MWNPRISSNQEWQWNCYQWWQELYHTKDFCTNFILSSTTQLCPGEESGNQMNFHRFFLHIESPWQIEFQHHPQTTFAKEKQANSKLSGKLQNRPKTLPTTCDDDHPPCLKYANSDKFTERRNQTKKVPGMHPRRGTGQHGWARHGWPLWPLSLHNPWLTLISCSLFSCTGFPEVTWMSIPQIFDFLL